MCSPLPDEVTVLPFPHRELTAETAQGVIPTDAVPGRRRLELDLESVERLNAGGLGRLVALHTVLRTAGGGLALRNVGARAYEVLAVTRLTQVLDVRPKWAY